MKVIRQSILRRRKTRAALSLLASVLLLGLLLVTRCRVGGGSALKMESFQGVLVCSERALVEYDGPRDSAKVKALAEQATGWKVSAEQVGETDEGGIYLIKAPGLTATTLIQSFNDFIPKAAGTGIVSVEPDYALRGTAAPNDTLFSAQWGLHNAGTMLPACPSGAVPSLASTPDADIDVLEAWDALSRMETRPTVVAVLDTGISSAHDDLRESIWHSADKCDFELLRNGKRVKCHSGCRGYNAFTDECTAEDDEGHGTSVSGIIGAMPGNGRGIAGLSPKVKLMSIKVLNADNEGCVSHVMKALAFVQQVKTRMGVDVRVLNNSYGCAFNSDTSSSTCFSTYLEDAIRTAGKAEMLFVASAGNIAHDNDCILDGGRDCQANLPASYSLPNIISVAATTRFDGRRCNSNFGLKTVHLGAPGDTVCTTTLSAPFYRYKDDTSMSAPFVSGAAALLLSRPGCNLTVAQLKESIVRSARRIPDLAGKTVSGGVLNVNDALTYSATNFCPR